MMGLTDAGKLIEEDALTIDGDAAVLSGLGELFDTFPRRFPIVTQRSL